MDIDLSVLRSLESEKDISSETAIRAIEDALLMAYHKTEGANPAARVEIDRNSGHVTVWARETSEEGVHGESGSTTTPRPASAESPRPRPGR
jgi:transcription termination/antitermination protein NusA